ncbi:response regulator transcription factor [Mycolicibacterium wolinskyi]|uniref:Two-component system response regulator n=1 Tax=Mycolicibacterium wolinskyi TaxID=59750 RepID=A0A1X2F4P1_9MYCO|nr:MULTISPECIES: response regulator transcription factor [Mycolicibacterium]MCV7289068.1 response regulator transcription factor [Mycolicibacterium wolinskyi]MCV7296495.1 response regulator transcription factor [Mycolicibacterium goodii]ORX13410.1 two-component system response regulator [Mycolicibacterium wolinskyi]
MTRPDGTPIRVLLVDDERALTGLVSRALHYEGWQIETAHDARDALAKYQEHAPDVIVLDIMMPGADGFSVLDQIRAPAESCRYTPVLFLTARDSVADRVAGLTAGGDDYLTKPFSLEELVARLRGLLRRIAYTTPEADEILFVGDLELRAASREVLRDGTPLSLTSTEFDLLRYMMRNPYRALSREELLQRVWGFDVAARSSVVELYVSYLRKKIDAGRAPMIQTVRGAGYLIRPAQ